MLGCRHQVEQNHADAEWLVARNPLPEFLEAGEQKSGVARFVEIGFVPEAAEIADGADENSKRSP